MGAQELQVALPEYEVTKELGRGAMGIVYLGRHRALDRLVAIKELPSSFAVDTAVRERFLTEARVVAALDHPHVVVIHDFVERDGTLALVMEHLPNGTVWDQFLNHGLAAPRACGLVLATLAGVHHAHDRGILHRDIKPENLIFTHDWQLKVTDFGIAQVLTGSETMGTEEGAIVGTPAYMSPEQAEGRSCGPQADVYASGAMLYEMLTGSLPFPNETTAMGMAMARLNSDPIPIQSAGPSIPGAIGEVAMAALTRNEGDRFGTAEDFGVALGEAAAQTWGPEWMSESGIAVRGSEAIEQASRTTGDGLVRHRASDADERAVVEAAEPAADATPLSIHDSAIKGVEAEAEADVAGAPAIEAAAAGAAAPVSPPPPTPTAPPVDAARMAAVIPQQRDRMVGANLHDLVPDDMLNMAEVRSPQSPLVAALVAVLALGAALLIALTGLGADPAPDDRATATVNGVGVQRLAAPAEVDLTEPFEIGNVVTDSVSASFLGIPIGSAPVVDGTIDPGYLRFSGAGVIEITPTGVDGQTFPIRATNSVFPTAPFVAAAMIALGGLASVQSNLRGMRSRRVRLSPYLGLLLSGAVAGAALSVLAMLLLQTPAALSTVAASAALFAVGSVALGETYRRWRRRRRLKRVTVATGRRR